MKPAHLPIDEQDRLSKLKSYDILDTPPEQAFDRITRIVAETIGVPIALVSLIDSDRQWFKSKYGLDASETPRDLAFCAHAILDEDVFVVEDALKDDRFFDNPLVQSAPNVRFYAGAPLVSKDGHKIGTLCAIDYNPRKISKNHIQLLEDLASLVIDEMELRVALQQAVKDAEEQQHLREQAELAERAKSQFLTTMSHEIRTPLNAIIGLTELVLKTELTEHQKGHLFHVAVASKNLLNLINDILDFSKITAGKLDIETIDFNINDVLANVTSIISPAAEKNGNELLISVEPYIPDVLRGDPMRIGQIIINLAGNAVKFTKNGEITISVSTEQDHEGIDWLCISVKDTGIGIAATQTENILKPFTQADQTITRSYGGTGLGLAISKQLIEEMGGRLSVKSTENVGSTFSFTLPLVVAKTAKTLHKVFGIDPRALRLLIVDDNEEARNMLSKSLSAMRFEIEAVASGRDAIAKVSAAAKSDQSYDLVLMDWQMPDLNGIETIQQIRNLNEGGDVAAILMASMMSMDKILPDLAPLNVAACLEKPININNLLDKMVEVFNGDAKPPEKKTTGLEPQKADSAAQTGALILIAEDNELNQIVVESILVGAGFTVDIVDNGSIAVQKLSEHGENHYAAVLMDIQMPVMDGLTATRIIRTDLGFHTIPILATTAHAANEEKGKSLAAGMNDHVTKPINARELITKLNTWVSQNPESIVEPMMAAAEPKHDDAADSSYFDVTAVIARLGLPFDVIRPMLQKLIDSYQHADDDLSQLIEQKSYNEAAELAHALKGVTSSLGVNKLSTITADIEHQLRQNDYKNLPETLDKFADCLRKSFAAVNIAVKQ